MSLFLNSLYTAVLVFKLRLLQCLWTPIFTFMTLFYSFFSLFIEVRYIFIQEIEEALTGILLFHLPPFALVKTEITPNDFTK